MCGVAPELGDTTGPERARTRATGRIDYVMAHLIAVRNGVLPFEDALTLTGHYVNLGALPFKVGAGTALHLPKAKALTRAGWLIMDAAPDALIADVTFRVRALPPGLPELPYRIEPEARGWTIEPGRWWARLSEDGLDLMDSAWITVQAGSTDRSAGTSAPDEPPVTAVAGHDLAAQTTLDDDAWIDSQTTFDQLEDS